MAGAERRAREQSGGQDRKRRTPPASAPTLSIGEVLGALKPEFSDITVSKLRFLEGAGLVAPDRTSGGYRKFSQDDVARLRFVLRAQRDQYLPLRVIRQRLVDLEAAGALHGTSGTTVDSRDPEQEHPSEADAAGTTPTTLAQHASRLTREELCTAAGRDPADLDALVSYGLVAARTGSHGTWYTADDLVVLRLAGELAPFGFEPRHLRMFKTFVDRELSLFGQVTAPLSRQHRPGSNQRAQRTAETLADLSSQFHTALLRAALTRDEQD